MFVSLRRALTRRAHPVPEARGRNGMAGLADFTGRGEIPMAELLGKVDKLFRSRGSEKKRMKVGECRPLIEDMEFERLHNPEAVAKEAIASVEQDGIVFIDEIDKIVSSSENRHGADASAEGVQRDLLPIIEGCSISTKYGNVNTDHILFIASGAFHSCKPSDSAPGFLICFFTMCSQCLF